MLAHKEALEKHLAGKWRDLFGATFDVLLYDLTSTYFDARGPFGRTVAARLGVCGPRYQWSRRVGAKSVTVALSAEQFAWLKTAIVNQRQVWNILMQMQQLTAQHALQNLPNPFRRKRLSKKRLGLN